MLSTNARTIPYLLDPLSLWLKVLMNLSIVSKLGIMDLVSTNYIIGICTSDVMSEAFPTHVITFWNTNVTS